MEAYLHRNTNLSEVINNLVSIAKENVINVNELLLEKNENIEDE